MRTATIDVLVTREKGVRLRLSSDEEFVVAYAARVMFSKRVRPKRVDEGEGVVHFVHRMSLPETNSVSFGMIEVLSLIPRLTWGRDRRQCKITVKSGEEAFVSLMGDDPEEGLQTQIVVEDNQLLREEAAHRLRVEPLTEELMEEISSVDDGPLAGETFLFHDLVYEQAALLYHPDGAVARDAKERFDRHNEHLM